MESPVHLTTNPAHTQLQGPAAAEYREAWMQALEPWHIERLQLTFDQPVPSIGDAGVGSVRRATFHNNSIGTSTRVAVKIVRKSDGGALPLVQLGQEILIQAGFNHPNVLPFFRYWLSPDSTEVFLLRPDAPFGSISEHVESSHATDLEKIKLLLDAAKGLQYLHNHESPRIHGDLKADNVVIKADRTASLCNLKLSQPISEHHIDSSSIRWCSPEMLLENRRSKESDVWAFGCMVSEVFTGVVPYHDVEDVAQVLLRIIQRQSPEPGETPDCIVSHIRSCWDQDRNRRPSIDALCTVLEDAISHLTHESRPDGATPARGLTPSVDTVVPSHAEPQLSASETGQAAHGSPPGADGYVLVDRPVLQTVALPLLGPDLTLKSQNTIQALPSAESPRTPAGAPSEITGLDGGTHFTALALDPRAAPPDLQTDSDRRVRRNPPDLQEILNTVRRNAASSEIQMEQQREVIRYLGDLNCWLERSHVELVQRLEALHAGMGNHSTTAQPSGRLVAGNLALLSDDMQAGLTSETMPANQGDGGAVPLVGTTGPGRD